MLPPEAAAATTKKRHKQIEADTAERERQTITAN